MLKNIEIWITEKCNSRCRICHWWKEGGTGMEISAKELSNLLLKKEFSEVESVQVSGGEPMMHDDPEKVVRIIIKSLPRLKKLLIATNGSYPEKTAAFFKNIRTYSDIELKLCVSIEGDREVHKRIRGIDSYDSALMTLKKCIAAVPELKMNILMTLTKYNTNAGSLEHIRQLALSNNSVYSFRCYYDSVHHSTVNNRLAITEEQKLVLIDFIKKYCRVDPFLTAQAEFLRTGRMPLMEECRAGALFVNIRSDGGVYPCINSTRKIGDVASGIYTEDIKDLGKKELCPCCDEACFYPMYNFISNK